jgi:hypothetical protein
MTMDMYRGVEITDTYFTGHRTQILPTLIRSVSAICRYDRTVYLYYVGVASGYDYLSALKSRIDNKKLEYDTNRMYLLYRSSSETSTRWLEAELVDHFRNVREDDRVWNSVGGGGGRRGSGPHYFIYLATSRA